MTNSLYSAMNENIATLKASRDEMENNLLCTPYTQSPAQTHISDDRTSNPKFRIVHHIKNALILSIAMIFLLNLSASNNNYTVLSAYAGLVQSLTLQLYELTGLIQDITFDSKCCTAKKKT